MANRRSYTWPALTAITAVLLGLIALPSGLRQWAPSFLRSPSLHYGLDLAGGTQLDFRISEREMREQIDLLNTRIAELESQDALASQIDQIRLQKKAIQDQQQGIVEAIRTVLERRINALGVSEAVITPSYIGNEKHLLVECPGVIDTQQCIDTVGKTIKLEFKEEFTEATGEYEQEVKDKVEVTLERITASGEMVEIIGQDLSDEIGIAYIENQQFFEDQLPEGLEEIWNSTPEDGIQKIEGIITNPQVDSTGQVTIQETPGIFLVEVLGEKHEATRPLPNKMKSMEFLADREDNASFTQFDNEPITDDVAPALAQALQTMQSDELRLIPNGNDASIILFLSSQQGAQTMEASHILIAYKGAISTGDDVTRTKEEAGSKAKDIKSRLDGGENFVTIARAESDGPSGKDGGSLGEFGRGTMVPVFEEVSFALADEEISDVVETQFGFHIIRADTAATKSDDQASYSELTFTGEGAMDRSAALLTEILSGTLVETAQSINLRYIFFSLLPTGWKDTNLDGKHFRSATVTIDPLTNIPIVQITFNDEGGKLFQELTKNNVGSRIAIFVGGQLVSAPVVQTEISGGIAVITGSKNFDEAKQLATDLNTGAIPAPIFLTGQRTVEATLGAEALRTSIKAALIGIIILMLYMVIIYRLLGFLANIALTGYAIILLAILKLPLFLFSGQHIVLTLAGMAGIILSIGMAVDANVLIFERMKEELRKGKMFKTAAETGFLRAWPSIRDGNVSTLITCTILFTIGTSIVKGFAVTLGMGVLISMFSALVITRWLIRKIADTPLAENSNMFGIRLPEAEKPDTDM